MRFFSHSITQRILLALSAFVLVVAWGVGSVTAQTNPQLNYQGKLTTSGGIAVPNGTYNMRFWLVTGPSVATTSAVWSETLTTSNRVQVTNGLFSVMLGSTTPLTGVNFNQTLYLAVEIGGTSTSPVWDGEMSPRKIIGTVPAAFEARRLEGVASSSFLRSDEADTLAATTSGTLLSVIQNGAGAVARFFSGVTEVFTITGNGNIGVGTSSPLATFAVTGTGYFSSSSPELLTIERTSSANAVLRARNTIGSSYFGTANGTGDFAVDFDNDISVTPALTIARSSEFVGIGTTTPSARLTVAGDLRVTGAFADSASSTGSSGMVLTATGSGTQWVATSSLGIGASFSNSAQLAALLSDETGTGNVVFSANPTFTGTATFANLFGSTATFTSATATNLVATNATSTNLGLTRLNIGGDSITDFTGTGLTVTGNALTVSTSTLGLIGGGGATNRVAYFSDASTLTSSSTFVFDGTNFGIGTTTPTSRFALERTGVSGTTTALFDYYLGLQNSSSGAVQYGGLTNIVTTNTATTSIVGNLLRVTDSTSYGNTVRGLEVQTNRGTNTLGENTAISGFGRTFGVRGTTEGDAGSVLEPAGLYGVTRGTTQGNAIRGYSGSITTAALLSLFQDSSAFAGTGLLMNFGNTTGSFSSSSSRFLDLQVAGVSRFTINASGSVTIGDGVTDAGLTVRGSATTTNLRVTGALRDSTNSVGTSGMVLQSTGTSTRWVATSTLGIIASGGSGAVYLASTSPWTTGNLARVASDGTLDSVATSSLGLSAAFTTSAALATLLSDETGTGNVVFSADSVFTGTQTFANFFSTTATITSATSTNLGLTRLNIGGDSITDFTGTGLTVTGNALTVSTSTLGLSFIGLNDTDMSGFTANRVIFTNSGGTGLTDSTDFTYNDTTKRLSTPILSLVGLNSTSTLMMFNNEPFIKASSTRNNLYIGLGAGGSSTVAFGGSNQNNTAVGNKALSRVTDGSANVALGANALEFLTSGEGNIAIGEQALLSSTNVFGNIAIGSRALFLNTTGGGNVALGADSLYNTGVGVSNIGIGGLAGSGNTSGSNNVAIGESALYRNQTGIGNIALGFESGYGVTSNSYSYNTFLGFRSARAITTGGQNVVLGSAAGLSLQSGARNIIIGASSSDALTTGSNNIAIGYNIDLPSNTGSNQLSIGNLLFGTGINGEGTTLSSGNIGIGTSSPSAKLSIAGDMRLTGAFADSASSTGTLGMVLQSTATGTRWVATSTLGLGGGSSFSDSAGLAALLADETGTGNVVFSANSTFTGTQTFANLFSTTATITSATTTNLATNRLNIGGDSITDFTGTGLTVTGNALTVSTSTLGLASGFFAQGGNSYAAAAILGTNDSNILQFETNNTIAMTIATSGNVGIGTTSPSARLTVDGTSLTTGTSSFLSRVLVGTTTLTSAQLSNTGIYLAGRGFSQDIRTSSLVVTGSAASSSFSSFVNEVFVRDDFAFIVSESNHSFSIVDISNPALPVTVSSIVDGAQLTGAYGVTVNGRYAYVVARDSDSLNIIDIANIRQPQIIGRLVDAVRLDGISAVSLQGRYVYVTSGSDNSMQIIDVSDPTAPYIVGGVKDDTDLANPVGITTQGNYAYVTNFLDDSMRIIDISNPTNPQIVGGVKDSVNLDIAWEVAVSGRYAYLATWGGFAIVDIANPTAPVVVARATSSVENAVSLSVAGQYVYVADYTSGSGADVVVYDVSSSTNPVVVNSFNYSSNNARSVSVVGKYAYIGYTSGTGLVIADIGGIESPGANIGTLFTNSINVSEHLVVAGNGNFSSLNVGSLGFFSRGPSAVSAEAPTSLATVPAFSVTANDNSTASIVDVLSLSHFATGTAANGIGTGIAFNSELNNGTATSTARIVSLLTDVTAASPRSALSFFTKNSTAAPQERMRLTADGFLGIGTTSPSATLTVSGDMRLTGRFADSASSTGAVGSVLTATANGTQWLATSTLGLLSAGSIDTSAELAAILGDETGTSGGFVRAGSPTFTGTTTFSGLTATGLGVGTTTLHEVFTLEGNAYIFDINNTRPALTILQPEAAPGTGLFIERQTNSAGAWNPITVQFASGNQILPGGGSPTGFINIENTNTTGRSGLWARVGDYDGFFSAIRTGSGQGRVVIGSENTEVLSVLSTGNVGIGSTTPGAGLSLRTTGITGTTSEAILLDQYLGLANASNGAVQIGNRFNLVTTNTATTTIVGSIFRIQDSTTFGNTLRGLEVQAQRGTNTLGENTALSGFARTFGVRGTTEGDAGAIFEPAGIYGETRGTTQGNAIRGYSSTITTTSLLSLFQDSSTFAGTGLAMNFGNAGGSFSSSSSRFLDFRVSGTSRFVVNASGTVTIGDGTNKADLIIGRGSICVDDDGSCVASTTSGWISADGYFTGNSDLAENYFSRDNLRSGEIVSLAGGLSVDRANARNFQAVIGIVSTAPGLTLGADDTSLRAGEKPYPIALSGRVPIRLSTENGPIKKGDQITLSSIPGIGMKATGTGLVVGVALEDFDDTRAYSETFINQFGENLIVPEYPPFVPNDPRINDGCYFGAGAESGVAPCVPLQATSTDGQAREAEVLAAAEAKERALRALARTPSESMVLASGRRVQVGQITLFVDRSYRYLTTEQEVALATLMSTSTDAYEATDTPTLFDRMAMLASSFVDGVLSIFRLETEEVQTDKLCVGSTCVDEETLRRLLEIDHSRGVMDPGGVPEDSSVPEPVPVETDDNNTDSAVEPSSDGGAAGNDLIPGEEVGVNTSEAEDVTSNTPSQVEQNEESEITEPEPEA